MKWLKKIKYGKEYEKLKTDPNNKLNLFEITKKDWINISLKIERQFKVDKKLQDIQKKVDKAKKDMERITREFDEEFDANFPVETKRFSDLPEFDPTKPEYYYT